MDENGKFVKIFYMPLQYPCGPDSACCGPIGQSDEELQKLKSAIEKGTGLSVEIINTMDGKVMKNYLSIVRLVRSFGAMSLPIITLGDEVVSMGSPSPDEAVSAIKEKIGG